MGQPRPQLHEESVLQDPGLGLPGRPQGGKIPANTAQGNPGKVGKIGAKIRRAGGVSQPRGRLAEGGPRH